MAITIRSCMENGRDVYDRGMELRNQSIKCFAIGTAVDSLLTVKKFVYERGELTIPQLSEILKNNWQGEETLRRRIMKESVKWGNDIEEADKLAADIFNFMADNIIGVPTWNGGVFRMGADSVDMAERYGRYTGATPDGRLAGEPLSKNLRPVIGMERNGVTAFIKSVTSVDGSLFVDGAPADFMLHPSAVSGEEGLKDMMTLVRVFMERGGMCIHSNVVDSKTLRNAMEHPENTPVCRCAYAAGTNILSA